MKLFQRKRLDGLMHPYSLIIALLWLLVLKCQSCVVKFSLYLLVGNFILRPHLAIAFDTGLMPHIPTWPSYAFYYFKLELGPSWLFPLIVWRANHSPIRSCCVRQEIERKIACYAAFMWPRYVYCYKVLQNHTITSYVNIDAASSVAEEINQMPSIEFFEKFHVNVVNCDILVMISQRFQEVGR